tara:strand:+ start:1861 stop:2445 length:585 start_codon:yes stop_codon:yes gene_type:complete
MKNKEAIEALKVVNTLYKQAERHDVDLVTVIEVATKHHKFAEHLANNLEAIRKALEAQQAVDVEGLKDDILNGDFFDKLLANGDATPWCYRMAEALLDYLTERGLLGAVPDGWQDEAKYRSNGNRVIAWVSSQKGFEDITAELIYIDNSDYPINVLEQYPVTGWYWAESEEHVKRVDLIKGVQPYPEPPKAEKE